MADNYTPEEIQQIFTKYREDMAKYGKVSDDLARQMKSALAGAKKFDKELESALKNFNQVLTKDVANLLTGKAKGVKAYTGVFKSGTKVLGQSAKTLGKIGTVLGGVVDIAGKYVDAVAQQADTLNETYQKISRAGVTGSQGMGGVLNSIHRFGYTLNDLAEFMALVEENSAAFAQFGGTASNGMGILSNVAKDIQRSETGEDLQRLGISINDMNRGIAGYMRIQVATGQMKKQTQEELAISAAEYIKQQDRLTKLTGLNAQDQQKRNEEALAEERFAAEIYSLNKKGDPESLARAKELMEIQLQYAESGPEIRTAILNAASGYMNDESVQKLYRSAPEAYKELTSKTVKSTEFKSKLASGLKQNQDQYVELAKTGNYNKNFLNFSEGVKVIGINEKMAAKEQEEKVAEEQRVSDKTTDGLVKVANAQRNLQQAYEKSLNIGVTPVSTATSTLSGILEKIVGTGAGAIGAGAAAGAAPIGGKKVSGYDDAKKMIIAHEGIRYRPYKDSLGLWTVGVGHLIGDGKTLPPSMNREFTHEEVMAMFEEDFAKHKKIAEETPGYDKANQGGKDAFIDLAFNMGKWWPKWPTTAKALERGDFVGAAQGLRDSKWYQQVKGRAQTITSMVERAGYAKGGIASGPKSGFQATLHGKEAIVPLPDGKKIPVEIKSLAATTEFRKQLMVRKLTLLTGLVEQYQKQVEFTNKILQKKS